MQPALVFPFNDSDGRMFQHLQSILPDLKWHFEHAYLCPPLSTLKWVEHIRQLQADDFFTIFPMDVEMRVGEHFAYLYQHAADLAHPDQPLHLCFLDRLAFALEGEYRNSFLAEIDSLTVSDLPLIFQRSQIAWETHPQNYRDIEGMVTIVGSHLFEHRRGKSRAPLPHARFAELKRREPDVLPSEELSQWPEYLRRKMQRGGVAREDEERDA